MTCRITLLMSDENQTFTESYYTLLGSSPDDFAVVNAADMLASARAGLLGLNAGLFGVRINSATNPRIVHKIRYHPPKVGTWPANLPPGTATYAEFGNACLEVVHHAAGGREAVAYMAGMPAEIFGTSPGDNSGLLIPAWWLMPWYFWQGTLTRGDYAMRLKTNPALTQVLGMTQLAQYPNQIGAVAGSALAGVVVGDHVQLAGFKRTNPSSKDLNGRWQVTGILPAPAPNAAVTYFLNDSAGVDADNFWKLGTIASIGSDYSVIDDVQYTRAGSRRRGESIGLRRGRSKSRTSHG